MGLSAGDRVRLEFMPNKGVVLSVNDAVITRDASRSLIDALLQNWAGEDPLSGKLKRLLLENPC